MLSELMVKCCLLHQYACIVPVNPLCLYTQYESCAGKISNKNVCCCKKKKKKKSSHESKMGFKDSNFNNFPVTILFLSEFQIITELLLGIL